MAFFVLGGRRCPLGGLVPSVGGGVKGSQLDLQYFPGNTAACGLHV